MSTSTQDMDASLPGPDPDPITPPMVSDAGASASDAGADAGPPPLPPCIKSVAPASAHDESIDTHLACNTDRTLKVDGSFTGLDQIQGGQLGMIDGVAVGGCVRVDFASPMLFDALDITASPVNNACNEGTPCMDPYCTEGKQMAIFYGPSPGSYTTLGVYILSETNVVTYRVAMGQQAASIVVCRPAYGAARGDIQIDAIMGCTH